jgi:hypothetical protein
MFIRRILVPALSVIVLACGSLAAQAQYNGTGPLPKPKPMPGPNAPSGIVQSFTPEKVASLLQAKGAETKVTSNQAPNGATTTAVRVKMQADDFGYDFDVVFMTFTNGSRVYYFSAPLNTNGMGLSREKLQGLFKKNSVMGGAFAFNIDAQTGTLMMQSCNFSTTVAEQVFNNDLGIYLKHIKESYQMWSSGE